MPPLLAQNKNKAVNSSCGANLASRLAGNPQAASYSSGVHGFQMMGAPPGDEETRARGVGPDSLNSWDWTALLTGSGASDAAGTKICRDILKNPKYRIYTVASLCVYCSGNLYSEYFLISLDSGHAFNLCDTFAALNS
jgi:hypothetical protein